MMKKYSLSSIMQQLIKQRISLLKEHTRQGHLLLVDTSAIYCTNYSEEAENVFNPAQVRTANMLEAAYIEALRGEIASRNINAYFPRGTIGELKGFLRRIERLSQEEQEEIVIEEGNSRRPYVRFIQQPDEGHWKYLKGSLENLLSTIPMMRRAFNPRKLSGGVYRETLSIHEEGLFRVIDQTLHENKKVQQGKYSAVDTEYVLALLYMYANPRGKRIIAVHNDNDIRDLIYWFWKNPPAFQGIMETEPYQRIERTFSEIMVVEDGLSDPEFNLILPTLEIQNQVTAKNTQVVTFPSATSRA